MWWSSIAHAQIESIYIEIRTDDKPEEISWQLSDEQGNILVTDDSSIQEANKIYTWEYRVESGDCYRFDINDSGGDGLQSPGYYRIRRGNIWLQGQIRAFRENNFHYSGECTKGQSCENPMPVTAANMYFSKKYEEYWFSLKSDQKRNFDVNTCKNYQDSTSIPLDTKLWIYDGCPTKITEGPEGALVFNDNFVSCSPGAGVGNYPINSNITYLVRIKILGEANNDHISVAFEDSGEVEGCMDSLSCNLILWPL